MSCYAPQNRHSESFHIRTDADFVTVAVPLEAAGHIGIHASPTRITDRILYLTEALRLQAVEDGIRHYGNSVFTGSLSSEFFSRAFPEADGLSAGTGRQEASPPHSTRWWPAVSSAPMSSRSKRLR